MNINLISRLLSRVRARNSTVAKQAACVARLLTGSPVDLSSVLGPVALLGQGMARGTANAIVFLMRDAGYHSLPLDAQAALAVQADLALDLWAAIGNLSFRNRLPNVEAFMSSSASGRSVGSNAAGVATAVSLESALNVAAVVGVGLDTFWSIAPPGRTSMGRLLAMDGVLTNTYEFDPVTECLQMLQDLVPYAPDALPIIRNIESAQSDVAASVQALAPSSVAHPVTKDMDLMAFAARVLASPDAWRSLVAYNNLRYPYVSDDPADQLGDSLGTRTLAAPASLNAVAVTLVSASGLYRDQRLRFVEGANDQTVPITTVDLLTGAVGLAADLDVAYTTAAVVTVYSPEYDVLGRVLQTGDTLLVPSSVNIGGAKIITPVASADRLYGADVLVTDQGRLALEHGDLALSEGRPNLLQALRNRLRTPLGSLPHHPSYGFLVDPFLGLRHEVFFDFLAGVAGRQAILTDPRVESVQNFVVKGSGDTVDMEFTAVTKNADTFPGVTVRAKVR